MARVRPHPSLAAVPRWLRIQYNQCRPWTGGHDANGYPRTKTADGKSAYPHRLAYEQQWGRLQPGERVYRRCGDRSCVNPFHLTTNKAEAPPPKRPRRHAGAKLSRRAVNRIRALWSRSDRPTQRELARRYGVSRSAISLVVRGVTWVE